MEKNSFKELEELELKDTSFDENSIKTGISSDIGLLKFIVSILEIFLPNVLEMFDDREQEKKD